MKSKKLVRGLCCFIVCINLFISSCFAAKVVEHWWGRQYYLASNEIAEFRLNVTDMLNTVRTSNHLLAVGATVVGSVAGGPVGGVAAAAATEGWAAIQSHCIDLLLTDLERCELRGKAIIVSLPNIIQGWNIKEQ